MATQYARLAGTEDQNGHGNEIELAEIPGAPNRQSVEPIEDGGVTALSRGTETLTENIVQKNSAPVEKDPFPWSILTIMYMVVISDGMAFGVISPFLTDLCEQRWGIPESRVGLAAGMLLGAYSLAQFTSQFALGYLSDVVGRKWLLLSGLVAGTICTTGVALSPVYWGAFLFRMFAGLLNANTTISKTIISDVTKGENRALGFAYLGASFSLARFLASAIGGSAAGIVIPIGPLRNNPFVLPCLIGGSFNLVSLILAVLFVPETWKPGGDGRTREKPSLSRGLKVIAADRLLRNLISGYALNSLSNGSLILALVVFLTLSLRNHGVGLNPSGMGAVFSTFGLVALLFQVFIFERLMKRMGIVKVYKMGLSMMAITTVVLPLASLIYWWLGVSMLSNVLVAIHICVCVLGLSAAFMTCLPVIGTMISNAADQSRQGLTQGVAQSTSALLRGFGPVISGGLFSLSLMIEIPYLLFWFLAAVNLLCLYFLQALTPEDIERVEQERPERSH